MRRGIDAGFGLQGARTALIIGDMKNLTRIVLFWLCALSVVPSQASAFDLAAVGVLNFTGNSITPDPGAGSSGKLGIGFGALAELEWLPMTSIQLGLLYLTRKSEAGVGNEISVKGLQIPLMVRISPIDFVSVGGGAFYTIGMGDVTAKNTVTNAEASSSFETAGISKSDVGLVLGAALKFPLAPTLSLLADARYLLGLKDVSTSAALETKTHDFQVLLGLNFGI
jgi:hypothetical protein